MSFVIAMAPWRGFHSAPHSDGHAGSPDFGSIPLAKWTRGEADRIDPAGLPRSRRDLWRAASPPFAQLLPRILQPESYAPITEEGRADSARRPEDRTRARLANLGWASPSVRSSLNIRQGHRIGKHENELSEYKLYVAERYASKEYLSETKREFLDSIRDLARPMEHS